MPENRAHIERSLRAAASSGGFNVARQLSTPPPERAARLTREDQDALRGLHNTIGENASFFARRFARERAGELITGVGETTRGEVRSLVARAVSGNWNVDTLADRLEQLGIFSDYRAEMIARTEVSAAMNAGTLHAARVARDAGHKQKLKKYWATADDPCPICEENEADGEIELDQEFSSGDDAPGAHPNCECELELIEMEE